VRHRASAQDRPKYIEEWVDKATSQKFGIDESNLWMCAQAKNATWYSYR